MFDQKFYKCPHCATQIRQRLQDGEDIVCMACKCRFRVMLDEASGKAAFVDVSETKIPEPLYLPKGSVRAIVTVLLAVSSWILIGGEKNVPDYLFGLNLAVIGYYFGFRKKVKASEGHIFDAAARAEDPLFLPAGVIRFFLIAGFMVCAFVLHKRGRLEDLRYIEFFAILIGLVLGYVFGKISKPLRGTKLYILVNHLKGAVVLCAAAYMVQILIFGGGGDPHVPLALTAVISFYFGSRS
jgi:DNA-directed RNA polymerase subunit RPC12/RpoP